MTMANTPSENASSRFFGNIAGVCTRQRPMAGNEVVVDAPMQGTVVSIDVAEGDAVHAGQQLLVIESMKMEHVVAAPDGGVVRGITTDVGATVLPGDRLVVIEEADVAVPAAGPADAITGDAIRADLADVLDRHTMGLDDRRPDAVERRRRTGQRTTRENV